jgi:predicted transcriptional regulator
MITSAKEKKRHEIILDVLHRHGVTIDELMSRSRREKFVDARVEIASRLVDLGLSYNRIGKILERDHSTVAFWLNHRRGGRLPQNLSPISADVRRCIEGIAAQKKTTAKQVVIEWLTERALFVLEQERSAA